MVLTVSLTISLKSQFSRFVSYMNRKISKVQIISPFEEITNNWELVTQIESSLNRYLTSARTFSLEEGTNYQSLGKNGLEQLIIIVKKLMELIETIKNEHKTIELIKVNAAANQEKLNQHEQIIRSHEKKFTERTKAMVEENRVLKQTNQKLKKSYAENEEILRQSLQLTKKEMSELKEQLEKLSIQKESLLQVINRFQEDSLIKAETINRLQQIAQHHMPTLKDKENELISIKIERKTQPLFYPQPTEIEGYSLEKIGIIDLDALCNILSYLNPSDIFSVGAVSKRLRFLSSTQLWIKALCKSIISIKNRQIGYYHKHIEYFEKLCHKIPEEVLQMTLFRYHILKQSAGQEIMQALNASSLIFQGRFQGEQLYNGLPNYDKEIPNKLPFEQAQILQVDKNIVEEFREDRSQEKDQLIKLFEQMYGKIRTTYELYRADEQTSSLFISNTLKHISRVFVLAKSLYLQVQNLQQLNSFLLSELNKWDRMEIDKGLQLEDLRAELEAEKKLKVFFTDKSIKSEQKALLQQNLKLTYEMKYKKLNDLLNVTCTQKEEFVKKLESLTKSNEKLHTDYRDLRRAYESVREKYNHVVEELVVVKETIIKMNIN